MWDTRTGSNTFTDLGFTIHDFQTAVWHNGAARVITAAAAIPAGSASFAITACDGISASSTAPWQNHPITRIGSDAGMPDRAFVKSIGADCTVTLSEPTTAAIDADAQFKIDNAHARSFDDGTVTTSDTTVSSATANFTTADIGLQVVGSGIPDNTTIASITNATTAVMSKAASSGSPGDNVITLGGTLESTTARFVNDGGSTSATNSITSAVAKFKPGFAATNPNCAQVARLSCGDTGLTVTGPGLTNCVIGSVSGTTATMTSSCIDTGAFSGTFTVGEPSATAPADGDVAASIGWQLDLNPTLVPGSDSCANNRLEGTQTSGSWLNPGSFSTNPVAQPPSNRKTIGEILFDSSAGLGFVAFVVERPAFATGDPQSDAHYDIVLPNVPMHAALCASSNSPGIGMSLGVAGSTPSIAKVRQGNGRPGTAQLRAIRDDFGAGWRGNAYVRSDDATHVWSGLEFERLCLVPAGKPAVNFKCGSG